MARVMIGDDDRAMSARLVEIMRAATRARVGAVRPRPVRTRDFLDAVSRALTEDAVPADHA